MWELDHQEGWAPKNWCFQTVVLEKTLRSPLDCKEIQPVHSKGDQSWVFIGRTDVEAETPILQPPDVKSWLIWKDPYVGNDWGQEEKGTTEDEMVGWTWVWVDSRSWCCTGRPGMLKSMGSQRVRHVWATELNWSEEMLLGRIMEDLIMEDPIMALSLFSGLQSLPAQNSGHPAICSSLLLNQFNAQHPPATSSCSSPHLPVVLSSLCDIWWCFLNLWVPASQAWSLQSFRA